MAGSPRPRGVRLERSRLLSSPLHTAMRRDKIARILVHPADSSLFRSGCALTADAPDRPAEGEWTTGR